MRSKLLIGTAALALTAILVTAGSASAQRWHRGHGWGPAGVAAGVIGGAVAAATSPFWAPGYYSYADGYYPGYAYAPGYAYDDAYAYGPGYAPGYSYVPAPAYRYGQGYATGGRDDAYCARRYRSYDPASGTYLGYDGIRHPCP
jgi:hypothetical protein